MNVNDPSITDRKLQATRFAEAAMELTNIKKDLEEFYLQFEPVIERLEDPGGYHKGFLRATNRLLCLANTLSERANKEFLEIHKAEP